MLQQSFKKKQQWVIRWKVGICNSEKRAKKEAARKTLPIWHYFTKHKKPDPSKKQNHHDKRDRRTKRANKKLFDQPIYALFDIADPNRSTSRPRKKEPIKHSNVEQPSVLDHFNRIPNRNPPPDSPPPENRIDDRFPDGWPE